MTTEKRGRWYQFSLRTLLLIPTLFALVVAILWAWPKSRGLSIGLDYIGHYRGLGLWEGPGPFGRSYYRLTFHSTDAEDGLCEVYFSGYGFNRFREKYPNGVFRQEGECLVEPNGFPEADPLPDIHHVKWGKHYRPDGSLGSEIRDGTGVQIFWSPEGVKLWELELRNFQRVRLCWWYRSGKLMLKQFYLDGLDHGPYVTYYPDGTKRSEGEYFRGERAGTWTEFDEDGNVVSTQQYAVAAEDVASDAP
jgi:hypothetical protein